MTSRTGGKHDKDREFLKLLGIASLEDLERKLDGALKQKKFPTWKIVAMQRAIHKRKT